MADSVTGKRITEFTELSSIGTGDFIAVDNASQDTKKYDATKLATKTYADTKVSEAINNLTIPTAKIEDGAVTTAKIADANVTTAKIANSAVNEGKIADSAVTSNKINNGAVATAKIADGAVNADKLGANAVTTAKINDGAVTENKIGTSAVTTAKINDSAVTTDKINNGAVTSAKLGAYSVTNTKIAENAVRNEHITDGAVKSGKLASNAVTEEKIYEGAVTTDKLGASAVTTAKINDSAVTTAKINNGAVTTDKLASSAVTEGKIGSGAVTEGKIGSGAVSTAKLADSAVTEDKLASSSVSESKIANGAVTKGKLGEDVAEILDNKAEINGYYEDLTAGSSEQLLSNTYIPDNAPYLFRTSGGSLEIGDRVYEDAIVGGSVAWNQLVQNGDFSSSTGWVNNGVDLLVDNNKAIATRTDAGSGSSIHRQNINYLANHKYLVSVTVMPSANTTKTRVRIYGDSDHATFGASNAIASNTRKTISEIINPNFSSASGRIYLYFDSDGGTVGDTYDVENFMLTDITLTLGSQIADYAYTLETSEAGSGIAWLKAHGFFTKDYYAYDAGSIKSVQTSAKKVVGFNQWDEQWERGGISSATGDNQLTTTQLRSKNYIPVVIGATYYFKSPSSLRMRYYDGNKNYIGYADANGQQNAFNNTRVIPSNCKYIRFVYEGTTYNNDICINLHWDGERDGEYEPYVEHTYPLDSDLELRGIPKLDSSNNLYYDGDTYASDGMVTRKYGIVDLGNYNWEYKSTFTNPNMQSATALSDAKAPTDNNEKANILCKIVTTVKVSDLRYSSGLSAIALTSDKYIRIAYTGMPTNTAQFKTAMSGVYLVYELDTATSESADPYTNPQLVDNWGTEQFIDEREVPVPVGHDSRYLPDLKAKLESAPNNPSTNGKYFLQYENGQASYVPVSSEVPQTPSEDGTYVLKATVASGVATLAWVAEE